ncbi:MAG: thioredoxin domain-containing protein [Chloroflexi bacterium]|uniref:Thioredoxin domain-containing protein n=1 Tax=Candidatus Chlorohelix allophototropha TaxID=3003348 RepID=A0A8T7M811_9CHLR|nr:thioredoxin domain-containing protein [Chloroflexota bacterium]WJW68212.1 thioredoxin domain-containing protein [Chloroflexota bacterium L227-S17]
MNNPYDENRFTNRLINETSPYLLQHAHNPVNWYPWGEEAFAKARAENKPVLLSVGYSACHWCHVMERESFENEEIAALMNENFVSIKVDREERPDIDSIYMEAVTALTGRGGWPMTVFLTPEGAPFYGGTYFPPDNRYSGMASFPQILNTLSDVFREQPEDIANNATELKNMLNSSLSERGVQTTGDLNVAMLNSATENLNAQFDTKKGGLGNAPKFPQAAALDYVLKSWRRNSSRKVLENLLLTLDRMAMGGMYDQLGGGFHRYSTDADWLVPHFEKMLYDNSQLSLLYLEAFLATGRGFYRQIAEHILEYIQREMTYPEGGFYSTQDADSEGEEGKFFVWSKREIEEILGVEDAAVICRFYNVSERGNWEGHNILHVTSPLQQIVQELGKSEDEIEEVLGFSLDKLFEVREQRIKPGRDEKILTSWNGLMLKSFAVAGRVLDNPAYIHIAKNNAEFVLKYLKKEGRLLRTFKDDVKGKQARLNAFLEDYAFFADGLLALYEATFDLRWLDEANYLAEVMLEQFWDETIKGFYDTSLDHEQLVTRPRNYMDNATPCGNSVAVEVLLKLALFTGQELYREKAASALESVAGLMPRQPLGFGRWLSATDFYLGEAKEIVIVGEPDAADTKALLRVIYNAYNPNKVVMLLPPGLDSQVVARYPLLEDRKMLDGKATAYVCQNFACLRPVTTPEGLAEQLGVALS